MRQLWTIATIVWVDRDVDEPEFPRWNYNSSQRQHYKSHRLLSYDYPARIVIHEVVIPHMGMPPLDNANFERLAEVCAEVGRYEFLLCIAPLVVNGGTGSPVNPIATF